MAQVSKINLGGIDYDVRDKVLEKEVAKIQPIINQGTIYNAADEEDITSVDNLLKLKDRTSVGGMGYIIVRNNKSLSEQVTQDNTIYEIRCDIDLNGETIRFPFNSTIYFNGGTIYNGYVVGEKLKTTNLTFEQKNRPIFVDGVNLDSDDEYLCASDCGMVPGLSSYASWNGVVLDKIIANKKNLFLDSDYYIDTKHTLNYSIKVKGGSLHITGNGALFDFKSEAGIELDNINLINEENASLLYQENVDYSLDRIVIRNCHITNLSCRIYSVSSIYANTGKGLKSVIIENNVITLNTMFCVFVDTTITNDIIFRNNIVKKFTSSLLYIAETDGAIGEGMNQDYYADVYFENNNIQGTCVINNSEYYTPLLAGGMKRVYYRNNVVRNIINSTPNGVAYDAYCSVPEYYCENNNFANICQLPLDGVQSDTYSEIFKSKQDGGIRQAINNSWYIDFPTCRELASQNGVSLTDAQFDEINNIALFRFVSLVENLYFKGNRITIVRGKLIGNPSSVDVANATIQDNYFEIGSFKNTLLPAWNEYANEYSFVNNRVNVTDGSAFSVFGGWGKWIDGVFSNAKIQVINNTCNSIFDERYGNVVCQQMCNNVESLVSTSKIRTLGIAHIGALQQLSSVETNVIINKSSGLHFDNTNNVDVKLNVVSLDASLDNSLPIFFNGSADVAIKVDGVEKVYKIAIGDNQVVTDEYNNTLLSYNPNSGSNGDWTTLYSTDSAKIVLQGTMTSGLIIRIYSLNEYSVDVKSPKLSKYAMPILNRYSKGAYKYDKSHNKPLWWNGSAWTDAVGNIVES